MTPPRGADGSVVASQKTSAKYTNKLEVVQWEECGNYTVKEPPNTARR